jgi:thiamine biosynthesis lipoprotein
MKSTRFLMGTLIQIEVRGEGRQAAAENALAEMAKIEQHMSRFLPASDIAHLNASDSQPITVNPETFWVIEQAILFSKLSGGAFDITVNSRNGASYKDVQLDKKKRQISLKKPGMSLDLGGIAKGYAVDKAIEALRYMRIDNAMVNAGGDLRVLGGNPSDSGWIIGVQHPGVYQGLLCRLSLTDKAVATSGNYYRHSRPDLRHHRILDPHRGKPNRGCLSVTIIADQALIADALATAAYVLGPDKGMHLIESLPDVEGILVGENGNILYSSGLQADWNENHFFTVKGSPQREKHSSPLVIFLGSMSLVVALTLGCQREADVQQPPIPAESVQTVPESRVLLDGTYHGKGTSGVLVEVEVTVESGHIADIQIQEYKEISSIHAGKPTEVEKETWEAGKQAVLETIPKRILEKQSTEVDIVTGATMTSETIMAAVEDALVKATPSLKAKES